MEIKTLITARSSEEFSKLEKYLNKFLEYYQIEAKGAGDIFVRTDIAGCPEIYPSENLKITRLVNKKGIEDAGILHSSSPNEVLIVLDDMRYMVVYNSPKSD